MSCKGFRKPPEYYTSVSVMSGISAPFTVLGNLALMLTIIIDPLNEVRTSSNLIYVNALFCDFLFGLLIDVYRAWGNDIRSEGRNLKKEYPDTVYLGKLCHVLYFAGCIITLICFAIMFGGLITNKDGSKVSYPRISLLSAFIWIFSTGLALTYLDAEYATYEWVMSTILVFGSLVGIIATYLFLYRPAKKNSDQIKMQQSTSSRGEGSSVQKEKMNEVKTDSNGIKYDEKSENAVAKLEAGNHNAQMEEKSDGAIGEEGFKAVQYIGEIESLLVYIAILLVFAVPTCILVYANIYNQFHVSCYTEVFLKGWKFNLLVTHKVFNPLMIIFLIPPLRRGCLHLLRLRGFRKVQPMS